MIFNYVVVPIPYSEYMRHMSIFSDESPTLPERGITLFPPDNDEIEREEQMQCTFLITCKSPPYNVNISAIDVISSAKAIEVTFLSKQIVKRINYS